MTDSEALSDAEMFTDEELDAVRRAATGRAMWFTDHLGDPSEYDDCLRVSRLYLIDMLVMGVDLVPNWLQMTPHRPLPPHERWTPGMRRRYAALMEEVERRRSWSANGWSAKRGTRSRGGGSRLGDARPETGSRLGHA